MKKTIFGSIALLALLFVGCCGGDKQQQITVDQSLYSAEYNVFVVADAGRNGAYDQVRVGEVLGVYADQLEPEYILNCGDMFHYDGIQSVNDPLLISNFESIYPHGELQCKWWGVLGNHEYRGNSQAAIDYTYISRRWNLPERYYTRVFEGHGDAKGESVQVFFIDSVPLIDKYHEESETYPDAQGQSPEAQVKWLEEELARSTARWKIAICHHPIYSYSKKSPAETSQMQERVVDLFHKYNVDISLSGHVHTFQHLQPTDAPTDYFVAPSASRGRDPMFGEYTTAAIEGTGFLVLGFRKDKVAVSMIDKDGKLTYSYEITK
ncbi:MAG: metallophosphoesterase [Rikenellaceae bacterium]